MRTVLPAAACLALMAASGAAHAVLTGRWQPAASFVEPQAGLDAVPTTLGPWVSRPAPLDLEPDDLTRVGIRAHLSREYRHRTSGRAVTLLVVGGRPGPISVHTPDVCFQGAGYQQQGTAVAAPLGAAGSRLWEATFVKPSATTPSRLLVAWGWDGGGGWEAPEHRRARVQYARRPALFKVYLVTDLTKATAGGDEALADLASRLLPVLHDALYPAG